VKKGGLLAVVFFVKYPELGKVKTRLAAEIGKKNALKLHTALAEASYQRISGSGHDVVVCFTPPEKFNKTKEWLKRADLYIRQEGRGLGVRMSRAFADCFEAGYKKVLLAGSDIPGLDKTVIGDAFGKLKRSRAVIGPAEDGGYYLIGFRAGSFDRRVFAGIKWGTAGVFDMTVKKMNALNISFLTVRTLNDIDRKKDLNKERLRLR
jgi:rSAM/selenodomain-associated transferase 1